MPSRFKVNVRIRSRALTVIPRRRGLALFGGAILTAGTILLLYANLDFGRYAVTGLFWSEAQGTVTNTRTTSTPTIQFLTRDGVPYAFEEDYILLCGGRGSFCFVRSFDPGEVVPVVYDPGTPARAFVHDWALFAGVITWFAEAGAGLFFAGLCALAFVNKPLEMSLRLGGGSDPSARG
jgi:hypothetical protein